MSITNKHADYDKHVETWEKLDDVCGGQEVIKEAKQKYLKLPLLFKCKADPHGTARYEEYLQRAMFPGVTSNTLASHIGLAFGKTPVFNRPPELEYLERNADGAGRSIWQAAQRATRLVSKNYRCGVYVDYPNVSPRKTKADERTSGAFPMIHIIKAKNILDWDHIVVGNQKKLSFVKIFETVQIRDGFNLKSSEQIRVLLLEDAGHGEFVYTVQVYTKNDKGNFVAGPKFIPADHDGAPWGYIPFTFCGAIDNSDEIHTAPLYELAELELSYYASTADVEESAFIVGQPTLCLINPTKEQYEWAMEAGISVGCRNALPCDARFVQADKNSLAYERMQDKWEQMKELGARLIEVGSANKTATQANNEASIQHSSLSLVVANVSEAFTNALRWCAKFAMPTHDFKVDELSFQIAQDFNKPKYDAQRSKLIYESCLAGLLPMYVWYHYEQTGTFPEDKWDDVAGRLESVEDGVAH